MFVHQLISPDLPVLHLSDTGEQALALMQEVHVAHLALTDADEYKALVGEHDLLNWETPEKPLSAANFLNFRPVVFADAHPYEAARRAVQQGISIVPVIDETNKYLGALTRNELLDFLCKNSGLDQPGGIIALEVKMANYSLSEIARICENNDVIVLNTQLQSNPENDTIEVILKTNTKELQSLVASFERYEYSVKEVFGELPARENMLERYQLLMNYINM